MYTYDAAGTLTDKDFQLVLWDAAHVARASAVGRRPQAMLTSPWSDAPIALQREAKSGASE